jgi:large subunit ribosomal protein L17
MHRHGYRGRKFGRKADQREALIKGLADSLVLRESIETTLPKAKEVVSYTERLITKAKKGGLHNRRQIIAALSTIEAAHKLVDELAPRLKARDSGHLRIKKTGTRLGDAAQLAKVSFVDDLKAEVKPAKKVEAAAKPKATKPAAKTPAKRTK